MGGEPPRACGPILRYFDGEVALVKTFWLASGLGLMGYVGAFIAHQSLGALTTVLKYALFVLLFYLWVSVYGSAEAYIRARQATLEVFCGYLARAVAVLVLVLVLITLFLLVVLFSGGASYHLW